MTRKEKQDVLDRAKLLRSRTGQWLQVYVPLLFGLIWMVLAAVGYLIP